MYAAKTPRVERQELEKLHETLQQLEARARDKDEDDNGNHGGFASANDELDAFEHRLETGPMVRKATRPVAARQPPKKEQRLAGLIIPRNTYTEGQRRAIARLRADAHKEKKPVHTKQMSEEEREQQQERQDDIDAVRRLDEHDMARAGGDDDSDGSGDDNKARMLCSRDDAVCESPPRQQQVAASSSALSRVHVSVADTTMATHDADEVDNNNVDSHLDNNNVSSLGEDVNALLTSYVAALAAKDDDILRLYDDNKQLRALVERSLTEKEHVDAHYRDALVRVAALQSELHAKSAAAAACEAQRHTLAVTLDEVTAALREGDDDSSSNNKARLQPRQEEGDKAAVAAAVRTLRAQLRDARAASARDAGRVVRLQRWAHTVLLASEAHARRLLRELRAVVSTTLYDATRHTRTLLSRVHALEAALQASRQATHDAEARALAARDAQRVTHERQCAEAAQRTHELAAQQQLHEAQAQARMTLYTTAAQSSVDVLVQRCVCAEEKWAHALACAAVTPSAAPPAAAAATVDDAARAAAATTITATTTASQHAGDVRALEVEVRALRRVQQQQHRAAAATAQTRYDDLVAQHAKLRAEHEALRGKHAAAAVREQAVRQSKAQAVQQLTSELASAQERTRALTHHVASLEQKLHATVADAATHARRAADERAATQACWQRRLHACVARAARAELTHDEAMQRVALHAGELACRAHVLQSAHDNVVLRVCCAREQEQQQHNNTAAALRRELHEWAVLCTTLRRRAASVTRQLSREQQARRLLEQQHATETHMLQQLLVSSSPPVQQQQLGCAAPHSSAHAMSNNSSGAVDGAVASSSSRVQLLEQACRSSAAVIAQLREELHQRAHVSPSRVAAASLSSSSSPPQQSASSSASSSPQEQVTALSSTTTTATSREGKDATSLLLGL